MATFSIGDKVVFGRPNGEKTPGTVVAFRSGTKYKVRQDALRGQGRNTYPIGSVWTVPASMMAPLGAASTPTATFKVGQPVMCVLPMEEIVGVVTNLNPGHVEVYTKYGSMIPSPAEVVPAPKRSEEEILEAIRNAYGDLSPENLSCDGELSGSQVSRRRAEINRALKALAIELGRSVTEDEAFGLKSSAYSPVVGRRTTFKVPTTLKVGDKVAFDTKSGGTVTGFVKRVNAKTVSVEPIGGHSAGAYWRVSPAIVRKA